VTPRASRGFTLVEVLIGAAVALMVIGIVMATFLSQQRALQALDLSREAGNAARDAMLSMQGTIVRAGYGIDPKFAFDFRNYSCPGWTAAAPCRDKINGADEIVFVSRDANYFWNGQLTDTVQGCTGGNCSGHAWQVLGFDATHVTLNANAGDRFLKGQVLQFVCANGRNPTMGRVSTTAVANAAGALQLTLDASLGTLPAPSTDPVDAYRANIGAGHNACFDGGGVAPTANAAAGVSAFLVNRYRYHIATINGEPWLMLDRGLDFNQNGTTAEVVTGGTPDIADEIPIAHGVEGMQISYLLRPATGFAAPDNGGDWIIGNTPGTIEEPDPTITPAPTQSLADTDPSRFTMHPANIRGVRIRLTVRSLRQDITQPTPWAGDPAVAAGSTSIENRNNFTAVVLGRYRRFFSSVTVTTLNMNSKDPFVF
jgi:type IV pilus assembly protein PilW